MSHNYGDGGFWFTQPVGNGYSGAHAFGGLATTKPTYLSGPPIASTQQPKPLVMGSGMDQQRLRMVRARLAAAMTELESLPSGTSPQIKLALEQKILRLRRTLAALTAEAEAEARSRYECGTAKEASPDAPPFLPEGTPSPYVTPLFTEGGAPGSDMFEAGADSGMVVSEDIEQPSGVMGWDQDNKALAAGLGAVVGYFGYRHAKSKGWI